MPCPPSHHVSASVPMATDASSPSSSARRRRCRGPCTPRGSARQRGKVAGLCHRASLLACGRPYGRGPKLTRPRAVGRRPSSGRCNRTPPRPALRERRLEAEPGAPDRLGVAPRVDRLERLPHVHRARTRPLALRPYVSALRHEVKATLDEELAHAKDGVAPSSRDALCLGLPGALKALGKECCYARRGALSASGPALSQKPQRSSA